MFCGLAAQSQEPIDIWNVENKKIIKKKIIIDNSEKKNIEKNIIYEMQSQKKKRIKH